MIIKCFDPDKVDAKIQLALTDVSEAIIITNASKVLLTLFQNLIAFNGQSLDDYEDLNGAYEQRYSVLNESNVQALMNRGVEIPEEKKTYVPPEIRFLQNDRDSVGGSRSRNIYSSSSG